MEYILEGKVARPAPSREEWGKWMQNADRRVGLDSVGDYRVSTVFLGLDHAFGNATPQLFETMVFKGGSYAELYCCRYPTWEDAEEGHAEAVAGLRAGTLELYEEVDEEDE